MTEPDRPTPTPRAHLGRAAGMVLAVTLVAQAGWAAIPVRAAAGSGDLADGPPATADDPAGGLRPTIHYEEVVAHADDAIAFAPGKRVTLGFTPRADDPWKVGGGSARALPAGRLDGEAMRDKGVRPPSGDLPVATPEVRPPASAAPTVAPIASSPPTADPTASVAPVPTEPAAPVPSEGVDPVDQAPADPPPIEAVTTGWADTEADDALNTDARVSSTGLRREVFGFLPYWELNASSTTLDFSKLSTIAYFGVGADGRGNLERRNGDGSTTVGWSGWTSSRMTSLITTAHRNRTRVVLTVQSFAWTTGELAQQKKLLGSSTARANLARQIAAAVRDRGADGVNLDFEPLARGYGDEFTSLVRRVRSELNRYSRGYQLTFDTTGFIGNYPIEAATAPGGADAIFIMGYDYRTAGSTSVGSVAPLSRSGYDIRDTVAAYTARVPASKLILGVPYYGRAWSTSSDGAGATNISGAKNGASTTVVYDVAVTYLKEHGRRYNANEGVAWTAYRRENCTKAYGCVNPWRQLYVDDAAALRAKYDLVNRKGLRGIGIWALGYDGSRPELWQAIEDKFIATPDTKAPTVGINTLPAAQPNPQFNVSWGGSDASGIASYDVQVSNGSTWYPWLSKTTRTWATYPGRDGRAYAFRVRARDTKGNLGGWNIGTTWVAEPRLRAGGFGRVVLEGLSLRARASTSATKIATLSAGDVLAATGGPVSANGYTWYRVTGPLARWGIVGTVQRDVWVAARSSSDTFLAPARAPNTTAVRAVIGRLSLDVTGDGAGGGTGRSFSPDGDGFRDGLRVRWTNGRALDTLSLRLFRPDGSPAGSVSVPHRNAGPQAWTWDGRIGGDRVADGRYLVTLVGRAGDATFANPSPELLDASQLASHGIRIDTGAPGLAASAGPAAISPNGDGTADTTTFSWRANEAVTGTARVIRGSTTVRSWGITEDTTGQVRWNGRDRSGNRLPDATYTFRVSVRDAAGNASFRDASVRIDRTLRASRQAPTRLYPHDDDTLARSTRVSWTLARPASVSLQVLRGGTIVRSVKTATRAAGSHSWSWDGRDGNGTVVPRGWYTVRLAVTSWAGTTVRTTPVLVDAFGVALSASERRAGQTLTVTVRSVEALSRAPRISLTQHGAKAVTKTAVAISGGRYRVTFRITAGAPGAATIRVMGTDRLGGSNRSYASVTVR